VVSARAGICWYVTLRLRRETVAAEKREARVLGGKTLHNVKECTGCVSELEVQAPGV